MVYTISLLESECNIVYNDDSDYAYEHLRDSFHYEELEKDSDERKTLLTAIHQLRFGFHNYFKKCVYHFKISSAEYLTKIRDLKPQCKSQEHLIDFFNEAHNLINSGYQIHSFYDPRYEQEDNYVNIEQMVRFVWSHYNDPLNVSEELIDLANNSGWNEPVFTNDLTKTSKKVIIPQAFHQFIKLMDNDRFKRT